MSKELYLLISDGGDGSASIRTYASLDDLHLDIKETDKYCDPWEIFGTNENIMVITGDFQISYEDFNLERITT